MGHQRVRRRQQLGTGGEGALHAAQTTKRAGREDKDLFSRQGAPTAGQRFRQLVFEMDATRTVSGHRGCAQ